MHLEERVGNKAETRENSALLRDAGTIFRQSPKVNSFLAGIAEKAILGGTAGVFAAVLTTNPISSTT
jgi:hypothetical protein